MLRDTRRSIDSGRSLQGRLQSDPSSVSDDELRSYYASMGGDSKKKVKDIRNDILNMQLRPGVESNESMQARAANPTLPRRDELTTTLNAYKPEWYKAFYNPDQYAEAPTGFGDAPVSPDGGMRTQTPGAGTPPATASIGDKPPKPTGYEQADWDKWRADNKAFEDKKKAEKESDKAAEKAADKAAEKEAKRVRAEQKAKENTAGSELSQSADSDEQKFAAVQQRIAAVQSRPATTEQEIAEKEAELSSLQYYLSQDPSSASSRIQFAQLFPQYAMGTPVPNGAILGNEPHFIVDSQGRPKAALTEDGKPEAIMGKGGVEVVPLDPARRAAYELRKSQSGQPNSTAGVGDLPHLAFGGMAKFGKSARTAASRRPGASANNKNKTQSGDRAKLSDGSTAKRSKTVGDGRAMNGRHQGRGEEVSQSRARGRSRNPSDRDAQSIRRPVNDVAGKVADRIAAKPVGMPAKAKVTPGAAYAPSQPVMQGPVSVLNPRVSIPRGEMPQPVTAPGFPSAPVMMGPPPPTMSIQPVGQPQPMQQPQMSMQPVGPVQPVQALAYGGFTGTGSDLNTKGWGAAWNKRDTNAYVSDDASRWKWLAAGRPQAAAKPPTQPSTNPQQPPMTTPTPGPRPGAGTGVFVGSGGPRTIGNNVVGARFGFDKGAQSSIAGANQRIAIPGNPGVGVLAAHKISPDTLRRMTPAQRAMFESQIRASGQDPETYFSQAGYAEPGSSMTGRTFI
jgi:hypothetical protein